MGEIKCYDRFEGLRLRTKDYYTKKPEIYISVKHILGREQFKDFEIQGWIYRFEFDMVKKETLFSVDLPSMFMVELNQMHRDWKLKDKFEDVTKERSNYAPAKAK